MANAYYFNHSLQSFREDTFKNKNWDWGKEFSKAGFYLKSRIIQCFQCNLQFTFKKFLNVKNPSVDIIEYHRKKSPDCLFIKNYKPFRSRMFFSFKKSLLYEKERIDSFVEWPIPHIIDPKNLAKNVFFLYTL